MGPGMVSGFIFTLPNMGFFQLYSVCLKVEAISVRHSSAALRNTKDEFPFFVPATHWR